MLSSGTLRVNIQYNNGATLDPQPVKTLFLHLKLIKNTQELTSYARLGETPVKPNPPLTQNSSHTAAYYPRHFQDVLVHISFVRVSTYIPSVASKQTWKRHHIVV